jgi:hypothetical protein
MFLGIVLHGAISFMMEPPAFWPVRDNDPTPVADLFLFAVHDFRMQLFFLLAGFFACLLYRRYGLRGLLGHRLRRVAIPFLVGLVLIVPTVQAVGLYAEIENVRAGGVRGAPSPLSGFAAGLIAANPEASALELVAEYFLSGDSLIRLPLVHLWFLYYLLIFVAIVAVLTPVLGRLAGTGFLARADGAFRRLIEGRGRLLLPALATFPLMLPMQWLVDTPSLWNPQWHIVGYYFAFFAFGWMLYRQHGLVSMFGRGWRLNLVLANLVVLPVMVGLIATGVAEQKAGADVLGWKLGGFAASVAYTWLMIAGLWGAFLHLFARESAWLRYLADSAYWCYLASLTPILAIQFVVRDWPLPWPLKAATVVGLSMVLLLVSYECCVRYTLIGAILNGRRFRGRVAPPAPSTVERVPARV